MTSTELATTGGHGSALVLSADQERWNEQQIAALRQLGLQDASQGDLDVFFHVAQRSGLDPFARQIHMIARRAKVYNPETRQSHYETKCTIQTGIDGYRVMANRIVERNGDVLEYEDTEWCGPDGVWVDAWVTPNVPPVAARVVLIKNGRRYSGVAMYAEYVQTYVDNKTQTVQPNSMWQKMPAGQLAKCAEALAIRKAYPADFSGIYTDEEMGQADSETPVQAARAAAAGGGFAAARARKRQAPTQEQVDAEPLDPGSDLAGELFQTLDTAGVALEDRLSYIAEVVGRPINGGVDVTRGDARAVIDHINAASPTESPDEPVDAEIVPDENDGPNFPQEEQ